MSHLFQCDSPNVIGVDIGGTKINIGLVDQHGQLLLEHTMPTMARQTGLMQRVVEGIRLIVIQAGQRGYTFRGIGVGSAGQIHPQTGVVYAATDLIPGYRGTPIRTILQEAMGCPVVVDNDVNVLALAEKHFGSGKGANHVICLTIGTGVGGAIMINGKVQHGMFGGAGEIGHLSVDMNGRKCICGGTGCLEAYASGTSMAQLMKERLAEKQRDLAEFAARELDAKDVVAYWQRGDGDASWVMDIVFAALGTAIASLVHTFNPELIIIGGGVSEIGDPFFSRINVEVNQRTMPTMREVVRVVPSYMGNRSGVIGAAALLWEGEQ